MKRIFAAIFTALIIASTAHGATVTKGLIGEQDFNRWIGSEQTFSRPSSTGGTVTLNKVGHEVDALISFGGGSTYTDNTISKALSAIGTTNKVSLVLRPGTWAIANDLTIPSNVTLKAPPGALIEIATTKTLTINGPFDAGLYQVFSCVGTGKVVYAGAKYPEWWGAKDDSGTTDNTEEIQAAFTAGGHVQITAPTGGYYKITSALTASVAGTKIKSANRAEIRQATAATKGLILTASNIEVDGLKVTGTQHAAYSVFEIGIQAYGTDNAPAAPTFITGIKIKNCEVSNWGAIGIQLLYVRNYEIGPSNDVYDCVYAAFIGYSVQKGFVYANNFRDIEVGNASANAYGIALSVLGTTGRNATSDPASTDNIVALNIIRNIPLWECLDTHGGIRNSFIANQCYDSKNGLVVGTYANADGVEYAAQYNKATGNLFYTTITVADTDHAIADVGTATSFAEANTYEDNTIFGYKVGYYIHNTKHSKYRGGAISGSTFGVHLYHDYQDVDVSGITISGMVGTSAPVYLDDPPTTLTNNSGAVHDMIIDATGAGYGINNSVDTVHQQVRTYRNKITGHSVAAYKYPGRVDFDFITDNDQETTSGGGEDLIGSISTLVPPTHVTIIKASGTKSGGNDTKKIKFYYGSSNLTFVPAVNNTLDWEFEAIVIQTEAAVQKVVWKSTQSDSTTPGNTLKLSGQEAWTEDTAGVTVNFQIKGTCANAADAIVKEIFMIERKYEN